MPTGRIDEDGCQAPKKTAPRRKNDDVDVGRASEVRNRSYYSVLMATDEDSVFARRG